MRRWTAIARLLAPIVAALSTMALGCSAAPDTTLIPGDDAKTGELMDKARALWAGVGVEAPADVVAMLLPYEMLAELCWIGDTQQTTLGGCYANELGAVFIRDDLAPGLQLSVMTHELGHVVRGRPDHLLCLNDQGEETSGDDLMCTYGARGNGWSPTDRDALFVLDRVQGKNRENEEH